MFKNRDCGVLKLIYYLTLICALLAFLHYMAVIHVKGTSMYPTLEDDTYTICRKSSVFERGDIVVLEQESVGSIVKRVIGVAGDHVVMTPTATYINEIQMFKNLENTPSDCTVDTIVPDDCIFVVGDNRKDSWDSRYFGAVSLDKVRYKLISSKTVNKHQYAVIVILTCYSVSGLFMIDDVIYTIKKLIRKVKKNG